ncbi:HTH domain-containing protein [Halomontanus rarus]|uniref:HTH domain-containing protein n=1 Tax=Halomontanus rarus TaxID=3034020 RepID=UPI0023E8E4F3|nr:HTH domain-containing protein [Halovivax sp. TS33]
MTHPNANPERITLELWIRSIAPTVRTARRDRIVDRVQQLADRDVVDAFECNGWAGMVERDDAGVESDGEGEDEDEYEDEGGRVSQHPNQPLRAILESFERWADRTGRSLEPCFRTRRAESAITGESTVVCRPPTVALAEYHDGELAHVAPSRVGERVVGIEDRLDALVASGGTEREPSTRSTRSTN